MKKIITILLALSFPTLVLAAPFTYFQGGTGTTVPGKGFIYSTSTNTIGAFQAYAPTNYGCLAQASSTSPFGFDCVATSTLGITGAVSSVFARTGAVTAQAGDYASFYPSFAYGTSTYINYPYASSTFVTFGYGSSTYYLATNPLNFITGAYASSTFPSFSYGTSTYVSFLYASGTFPSFLYSSSTFPTYAYGSSTYYFASNPSGYITSAGAPVQSVSNVDGTLTISPTTGTVVASRPAITGDISIAGGSNSSVLATVNGNVGSFTNANITVNGKGLITAASNGSAGTGASSVGSAGFIQFASSTAGQFNASSTLFWDNTLGDLGVGTTTPSKVLHVYGNQSGGIMKIERFNAITNSPLGTQIVKGKSTGDMTDGFGVSQLFAVEDNAAVENNIADITATRQGADNTGFLLLRPYSAGVVQPGLQLDGNNLVNVFGSTTAYATLTAIGNATKPNTALFAVASSTFGNAAIYVPASGFVGLNSTTPASRLSVAGNASIGATYAGQSAPASGLIVEGNVGIGTTTPFGSLHLYAPNPRLILGENDGSTNNKNWDILANTESLMFRVVNDVDSIGNDWLKVTRSTTAPQLITFPTGKVGVGTSTPTSIFQVNGTSGNSSDIFTVATGTTPFAKLFSVYVNGHVQLGASSTAGTLQPTVVCGSGATLVGNDNNGKILCGTGVTTNFTMTFATSWGVPPSCTITPEYNAGVFWAVPSATTLVINISNSAASQKIDYDCHAR